MTPSVAAHGDTNPSDATVKKAVRHGNILFSVHTIAEAQQQAGRSQGG